MDNVQIYSILGVSKKEYNIPENWGFSSFFTSKGKLFTVNTKENSTLKSIIFGNFITEEELKIMVQQYYRKDKLNKILELVNKE